MMVFFFLPSDPRQSPSILQVSDSSFLRFSVTINDTEELQASIRAADKDVLFHHINTLVSCTLGGCIECILFHITAMTVISIYLNSFLLSFQWTWYIQLIAVELMCKCAWINVV